MPEPLPKFFGNMGHHRADQFNRGIETEPAHPIVTGFLGAEGFQCVGQLPDMCDRAVEPK